MENVLINQNWKESIKPNKLNIKSNEDKSFTTVVAEPLEKGYALTIGNSLRRILLSSIQGSAITAIQIDGVLHEFSSIKGVREDVTDIVLNVKLLSIQVMSQEVKKLIEQTQLKLESEKLDLSKTRIVSPIDGFILDRHISVGDVLGAYQKDSIMFTISETLSKMNIEIFIDESDIGNIKVDQTVEFSTDAFPDRKLTATITQIRYSPIDDQNVITYEVLASFENPNNILLPGMTANVDIIVKNKNDILKVKNSALSVKLNQKPKKQSSSGSGWGSGRPSQMQEIMGQLDMTADQQNKMRGVYPKLGKLRASLEAKNVSPEKITKEIQLFIENGLIELLTDEQRNKYFALKESLNVKKVYKLVDGDHQKIDLITGLNSGGYTEIIKGELSEGDEVISKITVETTSKKALRLF